MHRTDLIIVNGADIEYTKTKLFLNFVVNDAIMEYID